MAKCFYCDSEVIWQSDFDSYDIGYVETEEEITLLPIINVLLVVLFMKYNVKVRMKK